MNRACSRGLLPQVFEADHTVDIFAILASRSFRFRIFFVPAKKKGGESSPLERIGKSSARCNARLRYRIRENSLMKVTYI